MSYPFTGTGISYQTAPLPTLGNVDAALDDQFQQTVNTRGTSTPTADSVQNLAYGEHTLTLTKRSGRWMTVDDFVVETGAS